MFSSATILQHAHWNTMEDGPMSGQILAYDKFKNKQSLNLKALWAASGIIDTGRVLPPHCYRRLVKYLKISA